MENRKTSVLNSIYYNGILKTILLLKDILIIKLGLSTFTKSIKGQHIFLRKNTSDIPVFRQIFMDMEYALPIPFIPKIIIDAGANIGLFTIFMNQKYPNAKYICLEPEPNNFKQLNFNLKRIKNIEILQKALWNHNNGVNIETSSEHGEWGATTKDTGNNIGEIPSITIDKILNEFEIDIIDILKIDIEGAEKQLFEKDAKWLKKVKLLIIELHDYTYPYSSNNFFKNIYNMSPFDFYFKGENLIFINRDF